MGLLDTVKGWLNIGGVKVKIKDLNPMVPRSGTALQGKLELTSKSDKQVTGVNYKFVLKKTTGSGDEKKTQEFKLGETSSKEPFEIKAGETRTLDFTIPYSITASLKDMGGVLGGIGKIAAFASSEKLQYQVVATASVKGAAFGASDTVDVQIVN